MKIKFLSFDMDGTLVTMDFADAVWLEGLPHLYAKEKGISFSEARDYVIKEYEKVGNDAVEWYDIKYWFRRFGINKDWRNLLNRYSKNLKLYPEVKGVLNKLKKKYELIIISNAAREFIELEMEVGSLTNIFSNIFSSVSDFLETKKGSIYSKICDRLGIRPTEIVHIGDNWKFDYLSPRKIGIESFYLDRKGEKNGKFMINNLKEIEGLYL